MYLDCGACIVRDWRPRDRESLLQFANDRRIWRNLTHKFPHPYTEADATAWFAFLARTPAPTHWAVDVDAAAVGGIGVFVGEGVYAKSGQIGYWLGAPYWGRGIMTAAVRATSEHALARLGLVRLEAAVFAWNAPSMRVLEKCGFVREGVLRRSVFKDGAVIDSVLYARVAEPTCTTPITS
jgi:RimJ/RimL family protein N-acetyltransferase